MKEELIKLYREYIEYCDEKDRQYYNLIVSDYGPLMYKRRATDIPSFEGFMMYLTNKE